MAIKLRKFGELTWRETLSYYITLLRSPFVLIKAILSLPFVNRRGKTKLRYIHDTFLRFAVSRLTAAQFQKFLGPDEGVYRKWAKGAKVEPVIETIPDSGGTRLFWMGGRPNGSSTKVILYLHGGGYVVPMQESLLRFYHYVQRTVSKRAPEGEQCTTAILEYTLATQAPFPTQLREAVAGVQYLISSGIDPQNIIITGDSAGANLSYQLLQHILRPRLPIVPALDLAALPSSKSSPTLPFAGVFFFSPWFDMEGTQPSFTAELNVKSDAVTTPFLLHSASCTLDGLEPTNLEEGRKWILGKLSPEGLDQVVRKVLVYGGGRELLIDSILEFSGRLQSVFQETGRYELVVGEYGTHDDLAYDFVVGQGPSKDAKRVAEWFCETFGW